jgi:hypothetical protein
MEYQLAYRGSVFSTRSRGVELLVDLETCLLSNPRDEVVLDFEGVKHVSFSFVDEFVGRLVQRAEDNRAEVPRLTNLTPDVAAIVSMSLRSRELPPLSASQSFETA